MTNAKKTNSKSNNKGRRSKNTSQASPTAEIIKSGAKSVVFSLSAAFIFMLVGALIAFKSTDPGKTVVPISLSALYLSSILCGFISAKLMRGHVWINGGLSCFMFIMTVMIVSLILGAKDLIFSSGIRAALLLLIIPAVFAGVLLGNFKVVKKRKSPYRKR